MAEMPDLTKFALPNGLIEIVDPEPGARVLIPTELYIDGHRIHCLVDHEGIKFEGLAETGEVTKVTITFLPSRVVLRGGE